jgi:hypothetical protein
MTVPTTGTPLSLWLPPGGETNWQDQANFNWTTINTAIAALQAGGSAGAAGPKGDTGAVGMIYAGAWSALTSYVATDVVYYNGSSYFSLGSNVNAAPDTHPSSWAVLAAQGAQGLQGVPGPAGSGPAVTFPITLLEGGTGVAATTPAAARAGLAAAASGANADITALTAIPFVTLSSKLLSMDAGIGATGQSSLTPSALTVTAVNSPVGAGGGQLFLGLTGGIVGVQCPFSVNEGMTLSGGCIVDQLLIASHAGADPVPVAAGELSIGSRATPTANPGGGQVLPGTVLGYISINIAGAAAKIPYFAP